MMNENRRVLHGAGPSAPVLVVSGLGDLWEYLLAAAIALRARPGAELAFASRQALPEVLSERAGGGFREALLLGVGLSADAARLGAAFRALRAAGTKIRWISAAEFPVPPELPEGARTLFEAHVGDAEDLPGAVAEALGGGFRADAPSVRASSSGELVFVLDASPATRFLVVGAGAEPFAAGDALPR